MFRKVLNIPHVTAYKTHLPFQNVIFRENELVLELFSNGKEKTHFMKSELLVFFHWINIKQEVSIAYFESY